jgi:hypothetical protein
MSKFTATHGVEFGEQAAPKKDGAEPGPYLAWAKFEHDRTLDTREGVRTYTFSTDDEKVAERLRAVNDYGIAEVDVPAEVPETPETPVTPTA